MLVDAVREEIAAIYVAIYRRPVRVYALGRWVIRRPW